MRFLLSSIKIMPLQRAFVRGLLPDSEEKEREDEAGKKG
jgi:hypothetical protein